MTIQNRCDAITRWCLLLICGFLPFFFIPTSFVTLPQSKMLFVAGLLLVALVSWAVARFYEGSLKVSAAVTLGIAFFIPVAYAISAAVSGWHSTSLLGSGLEQDTLAVAITLWALLALIVLAFADTPRKSIAALQALFLGAAILTVLQAVHLAFPSVPLTGVFAGATGNAFGSWHEFGIALGFFLAAGLALMQSASVANHSKYLFGAVAALSYALLVIAGFADVWAALIAIAALVLMYRAWMVSFRLRELFSIWRIGIPWLIVAGTGALILVLGSSFSAALPARLQVVSFEVRPSWQGTFTVGKEALRSPVSLMFGSGPNTFSREWSLYRPSDVNKTPFWNVDFPSGVGSIPTSFVTTGLIGALAWLSFIGAIVWLLWLLLVRRSLPAYFQETAMPLALGTLYIMLFHVLYVPGPALNALTFIVIGVLLAHVASLLKARALEIPLFTSSTIRFYLTWVLVGLAALVLLIANLSTLRVLASEILLNKSITTYTAGNATAAAKSLEWALRIYGNSDRGHRLAVEFGLLQLQELAATGDANNAQVRAQFQTTLQTTIQHGLDAVSINDANYQNWLELATLYQELAGAKIPGALENARAAFERARVVAPNSPLPAFNAARLDLLEGNRQAALKHLEEAIRVAPTFAAAYYVSSQILSADGQFSAALPAAEAAVRYAPDDALAWYNWGLVLYSNKQYSDAAVALEQALARNSQYANALYLLGSTYYELGRADDALRAFQALDSLDPGQEAVQAAISNIKAGRAPLQKPL